MARAEKVAAVAELTERFQSSSGAVLAEYRGLSPRGPAGRATSFATASEHVSVMRRTP